MGLALATAFTVFIISYAYSRIIEHFPFGGGGYVVATQPARAALRRGLRLRAARRLRAHHLRLDRGRRRRHLQLPARPSWPAWKLAVEIGAIVLLVVLNLRGVKESVTVLAPIFVLFLVTHAVLLVGGIGGALRRAADGGQRRPARASSRRWPTWAVGGVALLFLHAYSMGAGTYTGIEAVSNGLPIMREPRVDTGKRDHDLHGDLAGGHRRRHPPRYLLWSTWRRSRARP